MSKFQSEDEKVNNIILKIKDKHLMEHYCLKNDVLFNQHKKTLNWRVVVPSTLTKDLIESVHLSLGHAGFAKTLAYIGQYYFWNRMNREIKRQINECDLCQRVKLINVSMEGDYRNILRINDRCFFETYKIIYAATGNSSQCIDEDRSLHKCN